MHDAVALGGEEHEDGEDEADEGARVEEAEEGGVVPARAGELPDGEARGDRGGEGDAEEDGDAGGDGAVGHGVGVWRAADDAEEEDRERRVQHHLERGIDRDEDGAVLVIAARQPRPDEHHCNTPREPHEDESLAQTPLVGQKRPREREHEERGEDPVEQHAQRDLDPHVPGAQHAVQVFEADPAEDGEHHDEEAEGDGEGDADEGAALEGGAGGGDEGAEEDAGGHGEEDPEGEEAVEEAEGVEGGDFGGCGVGWGLLLLLFFWVGGGGDGEGGIGAGEDGDGGGGGGVVVLHLENVFSFRTEKIAWDSVRGR